MAVEVSNEAKTKAKGKEVINYDKEETKKKKE